ncbi:hypothetical protein Tco_1109278 [Tanacetum coccineum]
MTYQIINPEQRIEFYSLNNVYVLPNNTAYSMNSETIDEGIIMAEPNDYISATRRNFISNDNEGRMVEKSVVEIQGTFLVKVCDNTFNGIIGENAFKHIDKFLEENLVERFVLKFHHLSDNNEEDETEEDNDPDEIDNVPEIFKIEGNLFDFETPLCKAFNEFNYLLKIDTDLFTFNVQNFKTYDEYERELNNDIARGPEEPWSENGVPYQLCDHICEPYHFKNGKTKWPTCDSNIDGFCNGEELPGMVRVGCMTYFQDHKWYDELADGKLKEETLTLKAKVEGSWGDATPGVMKFCAWLKNSFENFHELDYDVLVKLEECWWKAHDPLLDVYRNLAELGASKQKSKQRRFEMMKNSFNDDEEYITIKESEHLNHSKDSLNTYRELLCPINEGWVVATPNE